MEPGSEWRLAVAGLNCRRIADKCAEERELPPAEDAAAGLLEGVQGQRERERERGGSSAFARRHGSVRDPLVMS